MKYADARKNIRSGDLLAWTARKVESFHDLQVQAIRVFDRTEYVHVGVAWVCGGRAWVIESVTPVVRVVPLSNLLPCYHITTSAKWTKGAEHYALSYVGNKNYRYSKWEAIKGFFGATSDNNKFLQCAEFVRLVYATLGIDLDGRATPSDVVNDFLGRGGNLTELKNAD